jgi:hypothetical protein
MPVSSDPSQLDAAADLITLLQALPSCRMRRGVRYPQWWMLLVAILAILSGQGSLVGMERFAKRHLALLNEVLDLEIGKPPSDSTFRYLFLQLDVEAFEALLLQWMNQQPAMADGVDSLVCVALGLPRSGWQDAARLDRSEAWRRSDVHRPGEPVFPAAGGGDCPDHLCH